MNMLSLPVLLRTPLPFLGTIAAGWPSPAEEALGDTLTFEEWLVPHKEASCLVTVSTNAMQGAGIMPNDLVIMERHRNPARGDIVIAEVDGETVMRRYEEQNGAVVLTPANPALPAIHPKESLVILGVVASVIRKYK